MAILKSVILAVVAAAAMAQPVPSLLGPGTDPMNAPATVVPVAPQPAAGASVTLGQPVPSLINSDPNAAPMAPAPSAAAPTLVQAAAAPQPSATAAVDLSQLPVVDIDSVPFPSIFQGSGGASAGTIQPQAAVDSQGPGGFTANNMRLAVGGQFQPTQVPNGAYFPTFDVRPKGVGTGQVVRGVQSSQPWTQESVNAALGTAAGSEFQANTTTITSDSDMAQAINVAVGLNGAFLGGAVSVESTFGYSTSTNNTMHRVAGVTWGRMALPTMVIRDPTKLQLDNSTGGPLDLLTSDVDTFLDYYGTHFIKNKAYGCQAFATYSFTCKTQEAAQNISASLKANYNGGAYSVGGSVSTQVNTYSSLSICDYNGNVQATGLGAAAISPSKDQMLNQTLMGNWLEVPAVRTAISGNSTAMAVLSFWAGLVSEDLNALMVDSLMEHNLDMAIANTDMAGPSVYSPWAQAALFDRNGISTGSNIPQQYWQNLQNNHQGIKTRRLTTNFNTYLGDAMVAQAIASSTPATTLVHSYWTYISKLYQDATAVYQYAYTGVTAVEQGFTAAGQPVTQTIQASVSSTCNVNGPFCAYGTVPIGEDPHPNIGPLFSNFYCWSERLDHAY